MAGHRVPRLRVGVIGLGRIGRGLTSLIRADETHDIEVVGALVLDVRRSRSRLAPPVVSTLSELMALGPTVVVEAGGARALRDYGPPVLEAGCDMVAMSAGALVDPHCDMLLRKAAQRGGSRLRIPSGGIGGLDALSAAAVTGLHFVTHSVVGPARSLIGDGSESMRAPTELYRGPAREGIIRFPQNANVVAAVSLVGLGFDRTQLTVTADPSADRTVNVIEAGGTFGELRIEVHSVPNDRIDGEYRLPAASAYRALVHPQEALSIG